MFRYRYDTETGLYYLQSRYYNPDWGRFINADTYIGTPGELLSCNMFAYYGNDPVNLADTDEGGGFPATLSNFTDALIGKAEALVAFGGWF